MGSLIRATNLLGFAELVRELGGDPEALLTRHRIPPGVASVEDAFIPYASLAYLLDETARELGCPDFGLRLSGWQGIDILGPVAVMARHASTVADGFAQIARYLHIHSPALHLSVARPGEVGYRDGAVTFLFDIQERGLPYLAQPYELSLANGERIARLLGGADLVFEAVAFRHAAQSDPATYEEFFGAPVLFGQEWCGIRISLAAAQRPIDTADPATLRLVSRYLDASYTPGQDLVPRVAELVRRLLPTGTCTTTTVARHLGLHPRTLQRQLAAEGTTFATILDEERKEQAARLLATPGLQLRQLAGMLGYVEQSTFNRSFRRWYGTTPTRYLAGR
ncbi:HTH-type transcriptional regulator VirS [Amycolatopsis deserti]|uniref:HTH-type transcriptional regulator VirS n=1 Tax=Amycolatopsis deserti TaxID=185696 RepID=A0ABQ3IAK4_9PSEU|nr:AraC family transcriptional regulator [Amycolatopsis deserti]GHE76088.1 HTH-type transcriptional regulator VirS [Amycolatopsis deserti]